MVEIIDALLQAQIKNSSPHMYHHNLGNINQTYIHTLWLGSVVAVFYTRSKADTFQAPGPVNASRDVW